MSVKHTRPNPARALLALALLAALAVLAGGCGGGEPSDEEQVRDVLSTFSRAVEDRDYETVCDDVFAPDLLSGLQSIGLPCEVAMRNSLGQVRNPRLTVGEVDVKGSQPTAQVRTAAEGQAPSSDDLELRKVKGKWKVSALGGEEAPAATPTPTP